MRAEFAIAVDPIFERVLQTLRELDGGAVLDPVTVRSELLGLFDRADALQGESTQWQLAKYALAAWIDEMLLNTIWDGGSWWRDHILEMELFQTRLCSTRFFELARQASAEPCRDALEVFVNCVQLGFRGMLAHSEPASPESNSARSTMPTSVQGWLQLMQPRLESRRTAHSLGTGDYDPSHRQPAPIVTHYSQRVISGAPPLAARQSVVWWSLAVAVLLLINGWALQSVGLPWMTGR